MLCRHSFGHECEAGCGFNAKNASFIPNVQLNKLRTMKCTEVECYTILFDLNDYKFFDLLYPLQNDFIISLLNKNQNVHKLMNFLIKNHEISGFMSNVSCFSKVKKVEKSDDYSLETTHFVDGFLYGLEMWIIFNKENNNLFESDEYGNFLNNIWKNKQELTEEQKNVICSVLIFSPNPEKMEIKRIKMFEILKLLNDFKNGKHFDLEIPIFYHLTKLTENSYFLENPKSEARFEILANQLFDIYWFKKILENNMTIPICLNNTLNFKDIYSEIKNEKDSNFWLEKISNLWNRRINQCFEIVAGSAYDFYKGCGFSKNGLFEMPIIIGINYSAIIKKYFIIIYNEEFDDYLQKDVVKLDLEELISNLKNEFKGRLKKIFVLMEEDDSERKNFVNDSLICFLSKEELDFDYYLSEKLELETKILRFDCSYNPEMNCDLQEITSLQKNIFKCEPKWINLNVNNFLETVIKKFENNINEVHAIVDNTIVHKNVCIERIRQKKKYFCSFTVIERPFDETHRVVILGRYLLNDKDVKSLVKFEKITSLSLKYSGLKHPEFKIRKELSSPGPISTYKTQTKLMGIDLGGSRCVVCVSRNDSAQLIKIDQEYSMPTYISFAEEEPIIGKVARRHVKTQPNSVLFDFKFMVRRFYEVANKYRFGINDNGENQCFYMQSKDKVKTFSAVEIYRILFQKLKQAATEFQFDLNDGEPVDQAVITIPDRSDQRMLDNIVEAANSIGIKIIDIFEETDADLLYLLSEYDISPGESVAVIDIGGSTGFIQKFMIDDSFEKKIINLMKREFFFINGREIDQALMRQLLLLFKKYNMDAKEESKILAEVERIKEALSFDETVCPNLPNNISNTENPQLLTRIWFENRVMEPTVAIQTKPTLGREKDALNVYLEDINSDPIPSKIFLVGGTCRIPYIQDFFKSAFGEDKVVVPNKLQEITATGALIRGIQILDRNIEPVNHDSILPAKMLDLTVEVMSNKISNQIEAESTVIDDLSVQLTPNLPDGQTNSNKQFCLPD